MKKLFLFLFLIPVTAFCQEKDYKANAKAIFENIRKAEYLKAMVDFDTGVVARLDSSKLRKAYERIIEKSGPFVKVTTVTTDHQPNYDVVIQHAEFEKMKIDFKVVYGTNGKVKGISFLPGEPQEKYELPKYVATDSIKEKPVLLENGPYKLPGLLTTPKAAGRFPLIILVHGSGPNDKDETVGPTKIFKDLASGLAAKGIAVYRFDKRTRLYSSKTIRDKNFTVRQESIEDVTAAINILKTDSMVDSTRIYLCGHSLGGMLLPRIAEENPLVKGLIYLAPNGRPLEDMLYEQAQYVIALDTTGKDNKQLLDSIFRQTKMIKALKPESSGDSTFIFRLPVSYWIDLKKYDPVKTAQSLKLPMFFVQGGRDYQVTETDFNIWKTGLKDKNATFKMYPELNHFFVKGEGKSTPAEYSKGGNVDRVVINDISEWIISGKK